MSPTKVSDDAQETDPRLDHTTRIAGYAPALATERLSLTGQGNIRYRLAAPAHPCARGIRASMHFKTPYRDGTTHLIFEPLDFIARLAALVPKPRVNFTRFHGAFAPNSSLRGGHK